MIKPNAAFQYRIIVASFVLSLLLVISFYSTQQCSAEESNGEKSGKRLVIAPTDDEGAIVFPNRLEIYGSYENLSPNSYGNWKNVSIAYYHKERDDLTWFANASAFMREEGDAQLGGIGMYKTWNKSLSTYSSLSAGTSSVYLPKIRLDHEFNFKFDPRHNINWILGGTYVDYFDEHKDYIIYGGLSCPFDEYNFEYRIFRNTSDPGDITSHSHSFSLRYGWDRDRFTTLSYSFGKQAYLATYLATPEAVSNDSWLLTLNHRKWLSSYHGFFGEVNRFHLERGYNKTGVLIGVFREF